MSISRFFFRAAARAEVAVDPLFEAARLAYIEQIVVGSEKSVDARAVRQGQACCPLQGKAAAAGARHRGLGQPAAQVVRGGDAVVGFEPGHQVLPDKSRGRQVVGGPFERGDGVAQVAGNGPQTLAGQVWQEPAHDLVGADDLQGKGPVAGRFCMQVLEKGSFKAGVVDHRRTAFQAGAGRKVGGSVRQFAPGQRRWHRVGKVFFFQAGEPGHGSGQGLFLGQGQQPAVRLPGRAAFRRGGAKDLPADLHNAALSGAVAGGLAVDQQDRQAG